MPRLVRISLNNLGIVYLNKVLKANKKITLTNWAKRPLQEK